MIDATPNLESNRNAGNGFAASVTDEFLVNACVTFQETMLLSNSVSPPKEISLKTLRYKFSEFPHW